MTTLDAYDVGQVLGRGGFARVFRARVRGSGAAVAIKVIDKHEMLHAGLRERMKREVELHLRLSQANHPNIVQLHGAVSQWHEIQTKRDTAAATCFKHTREPPNPNPKPNSVPNLKPRP